MVDQGDSRKRQHPRVDVNLRVRVKAQHLDDFIEQYADNISLGGLFLRSREPHPKGTTLQFEIALSGGEKILRGLGEVVWSRKPPTSPAGGLGGMGVKFLGLDPASKELVQRIVDHKEERDNRSHPPRPAPSRPPSKPDHPVAPVASAPPTATTTETTVETLAGAAATAAGQTVETTAETTFESLPDEPSPAESPPPDPDDEIPTELYGDMLPPPAPSPARRRRPSNRMIVTLGAALGLVLAVVVIVASYGTPEADGKASEPGSQDTPALASSPPEKATPPTVPSKETDAGQPESAPGGKAGSNEPDPVPPAPNERVALVAPAPRPPGRKARVERVPGRKTRFGYLSLNTLPWTEVFQGVRKLGVTPLSRLRMRAGKHRLKLVNWKDGIQTHIVVLIRPGKTTRLVKQLQQ